MPFLSVVKYHFICYTIPLLSVMLWNYPAGPDGQASVRMDLIPRQMKEAEVLSGNEVLGYDSLHIDFSQHFSF